MRCQKSGVENEKALKKGFERKYRLLKSALKTGLDILLSISVTVGLEKGKKKGFYKRSFFGVLKACRRRSKGVLKAF